jgi:hypothetical protein
MGVTRLEAHSASFAFPSLLGLPLDIQKKIYTYAVVTNDIIDLTKDSFRKYSALLNVCTKTRKEVTPIFFSKNVFIITGIGSMGANYIKHADGHLTKLFVEFTIPPELHRKYPNSQDPNSKDALALFNEVKDHPEIFAAFLLSWEVSADAVEIIWPDIKDGRPSSDQIIVALLNSLFKEALKIQSEPEKQSMRRMMKQKVEEIVNRESKVTGKDAKLALKDLDVARKVAAELNGGKAYGVEGMGICSSKFSAYLKAEEAHKGDGDGSHDVVGKENKKKGGDTATGKKKQEQKKSKRKSGN